jgi:hypothetical protein
VITTSSVINHTCVTNNVLDTRRKELIMLDNAITKFVLTLITESLFCLGKFHLLTIRQYLGRLPVGHELEGVGATGGGGESEDEDGARSLHHFYREGSVGREREMDQK